MTPVASVRRDALAGALHGGVVWGAYAVLEQALCVSAPMWRGCEVVPAASYWRVLATVAGSFVALGLALGAACGAALAIADGRRPLAPRVPEAERFRTWAVITLAFASALHWSLVRPFGKVEALSLAVSVALACALALPEARPEVGHRLTFLANPWTAGLLMFGAAFFGRRTLSHSVHLVQFAGAAGAVLVVGCVSAIGSRVWRARRLPADSLFPARGAAVVALAAAAVLGAGPWAGHRVGSPRAPLRSSLRDARPNVVLVTLDTVRADHLSLYGYERDTTPFLRKLAGGATVYREAIAASNNTLTSHASLFTGMYGSWHGAYLAPPEEPQGRPLSERATTLAEILAANGYRTVSVVANYGYLGPGFGLLQGFGSKHVLAPAVSSSPYLLRSHLSQLVELLLSSDELGVRYCRADEVNRAVFAELSGEATASAPLLLFVNYMDAHTPYVPPAPFNSVFPGRSRSLSSEDYPPMQAAAMSGTREALPAERRHFVSQYDGAIRFLDSRLEALVARLEQVGLYGNTLLVIAADHGEAFGEHGLFEHGFLLYQDQVHVPLIVKYPGQERPGVVATTVSQTDVAPTVLDVLGLEAPDRMQGASLLRLDDGSARPVMSEAFPRTEFGPRFMSMTRAVVRGGTKLVSRGGGRWEMFDLSADPGELDNRYRPGDPAAASLAEELRKWLDGKPAGGGRLTPDEDALRRLRSLGYIQ